MKLQTEQLDTSAFRKNWKRILDTNGIRYYYRVPTRP